jgi:hypothetical protein
MCPSPAASATRFFLHCSRSGGNVAPTRDERREREGTGDEAERQGGRGQGETWAGERTGAARHAARCRASRCRAPRCRARGCGTARGWTPKCWTPRGWTPRGWTSECRAGTTRVPAGPLRREPQTAQDTAPLWPRREPSRGRGRGKRSESRAGGIARGGRGRRPRRACRRLDHPLAERTHRASLRPRMARGGRTQPRPDERGNGGSPRRARRICPPRPRTALRRVWRPSR